MKVKNVCKYCCNYRRGWFFGIFPWVCVGFSNTFPKYILEDDVRGPIREFYCPYFKHKKNKSSMLRLGHYTVNEMLKNARFVHREMQRFNNLLQKLKEKGAA